jgi:hypothetical protein
VGERRKVKELKASASWVTDVEKFRADFDEKDEDWAGTKTLKKKIEEHVKNNPDTGLTLDLFNEIVTWKLERQEDRTRHTRGEKVTEDFVLLITTCAFALSHSDRRSLVRGRVCVLQGIPGVDMGIASAITALRFPDQHGVIDPVLWKVIYGEERSGFSLSEYQKYLEDLLPAATTLGRPAQELDFFTWKMGLERKKKK